MTKIPNRLWWHTQECDVGNYEMTQDVPCSHIGNCHVRKTCKAIEYVRADKLPSTKWIFGIITQIENPNEAAEIIRKRMTEGK